MNYYLHDTPVLVLRKRDLFSVSSPAVFKGIQIPPEICQIVMAYLDLNDFLNFSGSTKPLYEISKTMEHIWKRFYMEFHHKLPFWPLDKPLQSSWRSFFQMRRRRFKNVLDRGKLSLMSLGNFLLQHEPVTREDINRVPSWIPLPFDLGVWYTQVSNGESPSENDIGVFGGLAMLTLEELIEECENLTENRQSIEYFPLTSSFERRRMFFNRNGEIFCQGYNMEFNKVGDSWYDYLKMM